jgi:hypothetical protein
MSVLNLVMRAGCCEVKEKVRGKTIALLKNKEVYIIRARMQNSRLNVTAGFPVNPSLFQFARL